MFFSRTARCRMNGKLVVGLGNPDSSYKLTRHNVGSQAVKKFAKDHKFVFKKNCFFKSFLAQGRIGTEVISLLLPQTYMNLSGEAVAAYLKKNHILLKDILIVYDDIALPLGQVRLKPRGSSGGHNGLVSIIERLVTQDIARLRIGIAGERFEDLSDYVLSKFGANEKAELHEALDIAVQAIEVWVLEGIDKAMSSYNIKRQ